MSNYQKQGYKQIQTRRKQIYSIHSGEVINNQRKNQLNGSPHSPANKHQNYVFGVNNNRMESQERNPDALFNKVKKSMKQRSDSNQNTIKTNQQFRLIKELEESVHEINRLRSQTQELQGQIQRLKPQNNITLEAQNLSESRKIQQKEKQGGIFNRTKSLLSNLIGSNSYNPKQCQKCKKNGKQMKQIQQQLKDSLTQFNEKLKNNEDELRNLRSSNQLLSHEIQNLRGQVLKYKNQAKVFENKHLQSKKALQVANSKHEEQLKNFANRMLDKKNLVKQLQQSIPFNQIFDTFLNNLEKTLKIQLKKPHSKSPQKNKSSQQKSAGTQSDTIQILFLDKIFFENYVNQQIEKHSKIKVNEKLKQKDQSKNQQLKKQHNLLKQSYQSQLKLNQKWLDYQIKFENQSQQKTEDKSQKLNEISHQQNEFELVTFEGCRNQLQEDVQKMREPDEQKNKHEAEIRALQQKNKSLSKEIEKIEKEKSELKQKNNQLNEKLNIQKVNNDILRKKIEKNLNQLNIKEEETTLLKRQINDLQAKVAESIKHNQTYEKAIQKSKLEESIAKKNLHSREQQLGNFSKQFQTQKKRLEQSLEQSKKERDAFEQSNKKYKLQIDVMSRACRRPADGAAKFFSGQTAGRRRGHGRLQALVMSQQESRLSTQIVEMQKLKKEQSKNIQSKQTEIANLKSDIQKLTIQINNINSQNKRQDSTVYQITLKQKQELIDQLHRQVDHLKNQSIKLTQQLLISLSQNSQLKNQVTQLKSLFEQKQRKQQGQKDKRQGVYVILQQLAKIQNQSRNSPQTENLNQKGNPQLNSLNKILNQIFFKIKNNTNLDQKIQQSKTSDSFIQQ